MCDSLCLGARHRWTGRFEAHLWDSSCQRINPGKGRTKGKQVYLGGYESETTAAHAYDHVSVPSTGDPSSALCVRFRVASHSFPFPTAEHFGLNSCQGSARLPGRTIENLVGGGQPKSCEAVRHKHVLW